MKDYIGKSNKDIQIYIPYNPFFPILYISLCLCKVTSILFNANTFSDSVPTISISDLAVARATRNKNFPERTVIEIEIVYGAYFLNVEQSLALSIGKIPRRNR